MDVNAESSPLPPADRDGRIDQDRAGDDQDWRDWYVTLAENDNAPIALVAGPGLPDVDPADDEQLRVELAAPTDNHRCGLPRQVPPRTEPNVTSGPAKDPAAEPRPSASDGPAGQARSGPC